MSIIYAPFDEQQVRNLNDFQVSSYMHPFTCAGEGCKDEIGDRPLRAAADGWHCTHCGYTQDWAHCFMADGSWRGYAEDIRRLLE